MFSNTFAGIAPSSAPMFIGHRSSAPAWRSLVIKALYPDVTPAEAGDIVFPHHEVDDRLVSADSKSTVPTMAQRAEATDTNHETPPPTVA